MAETQEELRARLNAETGKLVWQELERYFARGVVIKVASDMDLVDVAMRVVGDDKAAVAEWMESGKIGHPSMDDARDWLARDPVFWGVVAAPWVLVQEVSDENERN